MGRRSDNYPSRDTERGDLPMQSHDTSVRIPLRARDGSVRAYATVDADADWVNQWRWTLSNGYACRWARQSGRRLTLPLHRELLGLYRGDHLQGDHIDRDRLNCRRSNLRVLTLAQNNQNRSSVPGSSSEHRGVCWDTRMGRWVVHVKLAGKMHYFGRYVDELEAAEVARAARLRLLPFSVEVPA